MDRLAIVVVQLKSYVDEYDEGSMKSNTIIIPLNSNIVEERDLNSVLLCCVVSPHQLPSKQYNRYEKFKRDLII